jgi:phosphoglycerate dehydrogenase-like enzyme
MAERKIVVYIPGMPEGQLARVVSGAAEKGFRAVVPENRADAEQEAADAEVLFTYYHKLCRNARNLKWIATPYAGNEVFLEPGILRDDVILTNSSGAYGVTIAEHVVMVTLEMMRRKAEYNEIIR